LSVLGHNINVRVFFAKLLHWLLLQPFLGQNNLEHRSFTQLALHKYPTAVGFHYGLDRGKSEAKALLFLCTFSTAKALKDIGKVPGINAYPLVPDLDDDLLISFFG